MTSWLTFIAGIIVGLLLGWVIDLLYRRREASREAETVAPAPPPPAWATPLPDTATETPAPEAAEEDSLPQ